MIEALFKRDVLSTYSEHRFFHREELSILISMLAEKDSQATDPAGQHGSELPSNMANIDVSMEITSQSALGCSILHAVYRDFQSLLCGLATCHHLLRFLGLSSRYQHRHHTPVHRRSTVTCDSSAFPTCSFNFVVSSFHASGGQQVALAISNIRIHMFYFGFLYLSKTLFPDFRKAMSRQCHLDNSMMVFRVKNLNLIMIHHDFSNSYDQL